MTCEKLRGTYCPSWCLKGKEFAQNPGLVENFNCYSFTVKEGFSTRLTFKEKWFIIYNLFEPQFCCKPFFSGKERAVKIFHLSRISLIRLWVTGPRFASNWKPANANESWKVKWCPIMLLAILERYGAERAAGLWTFLRRGNSDQW